jgi:hypothetical protein
MLMAQLSPVDPADKVYCISLPDMKALPGKALNYKQVFNSALKLVKRVCKIRDGETMLEVGFISSAEYIKGKAYIAVQLDPGIRPYLLFGLL